jgi:hypothetical protein
MELQALWKVVRRWWPLIALPALLALLLSLPSLPSVLAAPVTYTVGVRFTAGQTPPSDGVFQDRAYIPWLASEYVVINLAAWVSTDSFAQAVSAQVAQNGGPVISAEFARGALRADAVRSLMTLYVNGGDSATVLAIAEAAIVVLGQQSGQYFPQVGANGLQVVALDRPLVAPVAAPLTARITPLLRVLLGLAAGIGLAFLAAYLDPTLRERADLERLGLVVLADLPKAN